MFKMHDERMCKTLQHIAVVYMASLLTQHCTHKRTRTQIPHAHAQRNEMHIYMARNKMHENVFYENGIER